MKDIMHKANSRKGFTFIEIMLVATISMILAVMTIAPYNFYTSQARVKNAYQKVEQSLSAAKFSVVSGVTDKLTKKSGSVGVWLQKNATSIPLYVYPFDVSSGALAFEKRQQATLSQTIPLDDGVSLSSVSTLSPKILVLFQAPTGAVSFYGEGGQSLSLSGLSLTVGLQ